MKKCPFCAELIQDEAIKCRYCMEMLDKRQPILPPLEKNLPWYFRTANIVLAVLCVGPLALPMIWFHPRPTLGKKLLWTAVITILFTLLVYGCIKSIRMLLQAYTMFLTI